MLAEELIRASIPTLKSTDSVGEAIDIMDEYGIRQLALVDEEQYKGLLSEDTLLNIADDSKQLSDLYLPPDPVSINAVQHIFEVIGVASQHQLECLPVLDEDKLYAGTIVINDALMKFADLLGGQEQGAVIVLKMANRDYSLADISRLVETNNLKIISSYFAGPEYGSLEEGKLTLKLNRTDVTALVATLERFGYEVDSVHASLPVNSPDRHRLDLLLRYLEA